MGRPGRPLADLYYDSVTKTGIGQARLTELLRQRGIDPTEMDENTLVELIVELASSWPNFYSDLERVGYRIQELER